MNSNRNIRRNTHCDPISIPQYNAAQNGRELVLVLHGSHSHFSVAPFHCGCTVPFVQKIFSRFGSSTIRSLWFTLSLDEKCTWRVLLGVRKGGARVQSCLLWTSRRTRKITWWLKWTSQATWKPPSLAAILSVPRLCTNPSLVFDNGKFGY